MRNAVCTVAFVALGPWPCVAAEPAPKAPEPLTVRQIGDGWVRLFDGETTFGWEVAGPAKVKGGNLVLGGGKHAIASPKLALRDFELRVETRGTGQLVLDLGTARSSIGLAEQDTVLTLRSRTRPGRGVSMTRTSAVDAAGVCFDRAAFEHDGSAPVRLRFEAPAWAAVSVRQVLVRPLGLKRIFNGKDLTGWREVKTPRTKSRFSVTPEGELRIQDGPGDLQTEGEWDDFVLQLDVFSNGPHLNSGVFFRCLPGQFWSGYESQIRNQWQGDDRTKPVDYGTGGIYNRQPARKVVSSDKEWFTMTVAAQGKRLAVWVNGYQTADFTDARPPDASARKGSKTTKGPVSLQGHDPTTDLRFRHIRLAPLPHTAP